MTTNEAEVKALKSIAESLKALNENVLDCAKSLRKLAETTDKYKEEPIHDS